MHNSFLNFHDMALVLTIGECLFLATLLCTLPAKRPQPRRLLAFFAVLIATGLWATLMVWNADLQALAINKTVLMPLLLACSSLLQGPALYFYFKSLSEDIRFLQWQHAPHLLPAIIAVMCLLLFSITSAEWIPWATLSPAANVARKFVWAMMHCLPLTYVLSCFWLEYRLRENLKQHFSTINSMELKLASWVLLGFLIPWLWSCVEYFFGGYLSSQLNDWIGIATIYLIVLQVNALFLFGFINTRQLLSFPEEAPKTTPIVRDASVDEEKIKTIHRAIHEQKLYLENNINLERFAELIGMKPRDLSRILNTHFKLNFFDFINGLRLDEAKRLLSSPEHADDAILDIIFKAGFNSQASFQRHFSRAIGTTPTKYRKEALAKIRK